MDPLRVIMGPTAAGKSGIAMSLAGARDLAIISADSRQVYRDFDIGTAKPTARDRAVVRHFGIDVLSPLERYSAHAWAADVPGWMASAREGGQDAVVVGGTGFYIRALVSPLDATPALDMSRRQALARWLALLDGDALRAWCSRLDPARAGLGRTQQLRAVETALLTGRRLSDAFREAAEPPVRDVRYLVVDPGPVLATRIAARVDAMLAAGWVEEVERLSAALPAEAPAWKASGYEVLRSLVRGEISQRDAVARVVVETRQYAKRQRTWCRHQLAGGAVTQLNPDTDDALDRALAWWDGRDLEMT
jgi:tRNA dimethylallyltransferase